MYLLKLAFRPWRLAPLSQVFSAIAVGFLLLMAGFMFWMERGLKPVVTRLRTEQVVTAYLDAAVGAKDEADVVDHIKVALGARPVQVEFVGAQQFVGSMREHYPELGKELEDLGEEMRAVIPRYVSITGMMPSNALATVRAVPGIESAESSQDRYQHIVGAFSALRWVARLLAVGLCLALFTGLLHLARMNAYLHQDAIVLLKLWGASLGLLRVPGMLSGLFVGLSGGLFAWFAWASCGAWLGHEIRALSPMLSGMPAPSQLLGFTLFVAGAVLGVAAGLIGHHEANRA